MHHPWTIYNCKAAGNGRNTVAAGASATSRHVSPITVTGRSARSVVPPAVCILCTPTPKPKNIQTELAVVQKRRKREPSVRICHGAVGVASLSVNAHTPIAWVLSVSAFVGLKRISFSCAPAFSSKRRKGFLWHYCYLRWATGIGCRDC